MTRRPSFPMFLAATLAIPLAVIALVAGIGWLAVNVTAAQQPTNQPPAAPSEQSAAVDHAVFDALLKAHVDEDGFVDYEALAADREKLDAYLQSLAKADLSGPNDSAKLATLINAYNAFMLQLVLDEWPVENILEDIEEPFKKKRFTLAGQSVSLDDVEHQMIRAQFDEPRIHWAVVCGAFSCPRLRNEAYTAETLEAQLNDQAQYVHSHPRYIEYDGGDTIRLTPLYQWYAGDFEDGDVLEYVARYRPDLRRQLEAGNKPAIEFLGYSWLVNDVSNRGKLVRP